MVVRGLPPGDDVASTRRCLETLGAELRRPGPGRVRVHPPTPWRPEQTARLRQLRHHGPAAGRRAGRPRLATAVLDGDESLRQRPMRRVAGPLEELGAKVSTDAGGRLPMRISDSGQPLRGGRVVLPVASAQVKSALLLAGLLRPRPHHGDRAGAQPRPHRAPAGGHGRRGHARRPGGDRDRPARRSRPRLRGLSTSTCRATSPRRPSSWWPARCVPDVGDPARRGRQPHPHRRAGRPARHGRDHPASQRARHAAGEPVADLAVQTSAAAGHRPWPATWCRASSTSCRSWRWLATGRPRARPWCATPPSCATRNPTGSPPR